MSGRVTPIRIGDIQKHPRPGMAAPGLVRFTPDSRGVTYVYSEEGSLVRSLWRYDIATGERRVLAGPPPASTSEAGLSREEELRRERARLRELGVTDYAFATKAEQETLLVPSGDGLRVRMGDEDLRLLEGTAGAIDPRLSPDGKRVAFVRDGELCVVATAGGAVRQLTTGAEDGLTNGLAEFIAQEELDRPNGFWWSADSERLAYVRADSRHIAKYAIVHQGKGAVDVEEHRYPFAGDPNAYVELGVVNAEGGETTWMDLGSEKDIYLARAGWTPDGRLTAQVLSRDQQRLMLLRFDAQGKATVLIDERQEPWLNLHYDLRFLENGEMLWSSEKSGYRHLYVHDGEGRELRQLTSGPWMVLRVVEVDEGKGLVYFAGTKDSVLRRHLYAVPLAGGKVKRVTSGDGCHDATVAKDGRHFIERAASLQAAPVLTLRKMDGKAVTTLFDNGGLTAEQIGLPVPELLTLKANDGTLLHGALYRPKTDALGTPPPLVVSVYGGPHAQRVEDEWNLTVDLRAQYLAEAGFAVFKLDNRGSANRGLAFEGHLNRRMGTVEVEDQMTGVEWLAEQGEIDPERVGIFGWSYGGYMTCMALMLAPEVFRVGVAGAPVTDWGGYDTGYTERYMGTPAENPEGYRNGSALTHAEKLRGKLLLVHGMTDENVHFRHTARLVVALSAAQKAYDLMVFPEERHMPRDAKGLEYQERRLIEYFLAHLGPGRQEQRRRTTS